MSPHDISASLPIRQLHRRFTPHADAPLLARGWHGYHLVLLTPSSEVRSHLGCCALSCSVRHPCLQELIYWAPASSITCVCVLDGMISHPVCAKNHMEFTHWWLFTDYKPRRRHTVLVRNVGRDVWALCCLPRTGSSGREKCMNCGFFRQSVPDVDNQVLAILQNQYTNITTKTKSLTVHQPLLHPYLAFAAGFFRLVCHLAPPLRLDIQLLLRGSPISLCACFHPTLFSFRF
jgi:hypothetical protein